MQRTMPRYVAEVGRFADDAEDATEAREEVAPEALLFADTEAAADGPLPYSCW